MSASTHAASFATGMSSWFPVVFVIIAVLVVAVFAYVIYASIRSRRALRRAGQDPDTIQADLAARMMHSDLLAPRGGGAEDKLAEIDRLHASGTITDDERAAARARVIGG